MLSCAQHTSQLCAVDHWVSGASPQLLGQKLVQVLRTRTACLLSSSQSFLAGLLGHSWAVLLGLLYLRLVQMPSAVWSINRAVAGMHPACMYCLAQSP